MGDGMFKLLVLLVGLCGAVGVNAEAQKMQNESAQANDCNCLGCCGTPLSLVPNTIRKIAISPIAIFWDRGPTFAEW
jgi:hypothetical protein